MQDNVTQFGVHYMLDGYGADPELLKNKEELFNILNTLPAKMGMHAICEPVVVEVGPNNKKDPGGLSGFVLVAESHISFHTFPGRGFVTIDAYTCNDELDTEHLTKLFKTHFGIKETEVQVVNRGVKYPAENIF